MMSVLDLDDTTIAIVTSQLPLIDRVSLRGTCRRLRALITAPRKRTPQKLWRWATRRNIPALAEEAIRAGARDLLTYADDTSTIDECRDAWIAQFAQQSRAAHRATLDAREYDEQQLAMTREIFDLNSAAILARVLPGVIFDDRVLLRIGKYLSDPIIREFIRKFKEVNTQRMQVNMMRLIIQGSLKKGRVSIKQKPAHTFEGNSRTYEEGIILSGNVPLLIEYSHCKLEAIDMYSAALSGSREMCEYVRAKIADPFPFGYMVKGAAIGGHVHIIDLALEWIDKCARDDEINFGMPDEYNPNHAFRADIILHVITRALQIAVSRGHSARIFTGILKHCEARAKLAQVIDYTRAAQLLRQAPIIVKHCVMRIRECEESREAPRVIANYEEIFKMASKVGAYWLIAAIYKLAETEGRAREINLGNILIDDARGIVALVIRGHYTRKVREHLIA